MLSVPHEQRWVNDPQGVASTAEAEQLLSDSLGQRGRVVDHTQPSVDLIDMQSAPVYASGNG